MSDITVLAVQREIKPKIEDVLPHLLEGEPLKAALDFVAYLQADKLKLVWAGIHNAWKAAYKGKPLLYIRLLCKRWSEDKVAKWVVTPYLMHLHEYEDAIIKEKGQELIWNGLWRCKACGHRCTSVVNKTILGKELRNLCNGNFFCGRNWVWFYDPDKTAIARIKRLLELEQKARAEEHAAKKRK